MKIEIELEKRVKVLRYRTVDEALRRSRGERRARWIPSFARAIFHADKFPRLELLDAQLRRECEGKRVYLRTCALVSLDEETSVRGFYLELAENGYTPASLSEGLSYLATCADARGKAGTVIHLGMFMCDDDFCERRLVTRKDGKIDFIEFHHQTRLKAYYKVVVVRKTEDDGNDKGAAE